MQAIGTSVIKSNGQREIFDASKLENSLLKSGASSAVVDEIIAHIKGELSDGMSTSEIYRHARFLLAKTEKKIAARYSLRRAIMDLGPSGFAFEDYIAEIFKEKGYKAETGKIVMGACVAHEVDVVAYNENKLIMVEAKFHNELGVKSDLKVALYVKARFDDLKESVFNYGKERKLDEGWLVTNTKFTSTAIQYGLCKGMTMIGWNYPVKGNLQDMIEDSGLHPLTCLTNLSEHHIRELVGRGIVLCKTLRTNPDLMNPLRISGEQREEVLKEIDNLGFIQ